MKWLNFIPPKDLLKRIEGVDEGLRKNQRVGRIGWIGFMISLIPIMIETVQWWDKVEWENLKEVPWTKLLDPVWVQQNLTLGYVILVALLLLTTFGILIVWNRFWLKESNAPFHYTFSVEYFKPVLGENADEDKNITLLSHHLCEKINERIGRLLLLDEKHLKNEITEKPSEKDGFLHSHIHISGYYTKRKDPHGQWILEIMPRVRIGPPKSPETLAYPIRYPLTADVGSNTDVPPPLSLNIHTEKYKQILERLYFTVSTEIYNQIKRNVKHKIDLLPSDYFRAVALLYEAEDYARSNTLEAYDEARKLYQEAIYYFDPTLKPLSRYRSRKMFQKALRLHHHGWQKLRYYTALIVPRLGHREVLLARAELGYVRMLLFQRFLGGILGQKLYPVFETRPVAERAVYRLERLSDELPDKSTYLFEALVTTALSWYYTGSILNAMDCLKKAETLLPNYAMENVLYNFALGEIEAHLPTELQVFQRVVDLEPRFEVAQFSLAIKAETLWRTHPSLERHVAEWVLKKYEEVLKLNLGNLGAWANRGYVFWLLGNWNDLQKARENFLSGRESKEIKRRTFIAELDHGLARIYAEEGNFAKAYEHFTSSNSANVSQWFANYEEYYYYLIGKPMFQRYERYLETVQNHCRTWENMDEPENEFKKLITFFNNPGNNGKFAHKKLLKKLSLFIDAVSREISPEDDHRLKEWVSAKIKEKSALGIISGGVIQPQLFFHHLNEKLVSKAAETEFQNLKEIVLDPFLIDWMERYLKTKANRRIRNSILAFAWNDYGAACYWYFLRDGDERYFNKAQKAYHRAQELKPSYAISYYKLYSLHFWKWELEKARQYLLTVKAMEPNWPYGKLAMAIVNSQLTKKKQEDAGKKLEEVFRIEKEICKKELELKNVQQEAELLREKISRGSGQTTPYFSGQTSAFNVAVTSNFDGLEETRLKKYEDKVTSCKAGIEALNNELKKHHSDAAKFTRESEELTREAREILESLLPHRLLWLKQDSGKFNSMVLSSKNQIQWEKEFNDLHVHTLSCLADIFLSSKQESVARLIYSHIQKHFWPSAVFQLRDILKRKLEEGDNFFHNEDFKSLSQDLSYCKLLQKEKYCRHLQQNRRFKLFILSREYRKLVFNSRYRSILKSPRHLDWLNYHQFNRNIFVTEENLGAVNFYSYLDLDKIFNEPAFDRNRKGPFPYHGIHLKELKDFFIEAAKQKNRSPYFYFWVGDRLNTLSENLKTEAEKLNAEKKNINPETERIVNTCKNVEPKHLEKTAKELKLKTLNTFETACINPAEENLEETADDLKNKALETWENAFQNGEDPHVMILIAEKLKSLNFLQHSLELYRRAMKSDPEYREQTKSGYHLCFGILFWMMGRFEDAMGEFDLVEPDKADNESFQPVEIVDKILPLISNDLDFYRLKNWLIFRERQFTQKNDLLWRGNFRKARFKLVREKYQQIKWKQDSLPIIPGTASMLSVVTPIAIDVHTSLFNDTGEEFSDEHPLIKTHYSALQKQIEKHLGIILPRLRVRLNNSGLMPNTYIIMIMEVPIVMGTIEPGKRFLPEYRKWSGELSRLLNSIVPAYDPTTGEMSGAWISEIEFKKLPSANQSQNCFEYINSHLEAVILAHIEKFLDLQQIDDRLARWQTEIKEEESNRKALVKESVPDFNAKRRLNKVLHYLVKESVPLMNLALILKTFGEYNFGTEDIIPIVEALRLAMKEELPGNRPGYHFLELSPEFEEEIQYYIHQSNGKKFLAIEPQTTQNILTAFRKAVQPYSQWKTVVVTRDEKDEGIRFYVRQLIQLDFPRINVLSFRELKPELRKQISASIIHEK